MAFVQSNGIVTRPVSSKSFITAFAPGHESETIKPLDYVRQFYIPQSDETSLR